MGSEMCIRDRLKVDVDRIQEWRGKGAVPTEAVRRLLRRLESTGDKAASAETKAKPTDLQVETSAAEAIEPADEKKSFDEPAPEATSET